MGSTQVDLLDIVHVKVWFLPALKMGIRAGLGKFACDIFKLKSEFYILFSDLNITLCRVLKK